MLNIIGVVLIVLMLALVAGFLTCAALNSSQDQSKH